MNGDTNTKWMPGGCSMSDVENVVRDHPWTAMATSLLGGFCVGLVITRLVDSAVSVDQPSTMERFGRSVADSFGRMVPGGLRAR